jgi:double zinc ribbon protein
MGQQMDSGSHQGARAILRVIGPVVLGVGLLFAVVGIGNFFMSFGSFGGPPRYFWCAFVGLPLIGVGIAICKFAFMGAITRYVANEVAPVGKDVVNYMADGTQDAVRDIASAIGEGLSTSPSDRELHGVRCHKCNENNEASAKFCKSCGASLSKSVTCSNCGELNDPDARFCDHCGQGIV